MSTGIMVTEDPRALTYDVATFKRFHRKAVQENVQVQRSGSDPSVYRVSSANNPGVWYIVSVVDYSEILPSVAQCSCMAAEKNYCCKHGAAVLSAEGKRRGKSASETMNALRKLSKEMA